MNIYIHFQVLSGITTASLDFLIWFLTQFPSNPSHQIGHEPFGSPWTRWDSISSLNAPVTLSVVLTMRESWATVPLQLVSCSSRPLIPSSQNQVKSSSVQIRAIRSHNSFGSTSKLFLSNSTRTSPAKGRVKTKTKLSTVDKWILKAFFMGSKNSDTWTGNNMELLLKIILQLVQNVLWLVTFVEVVLYLC